MKKNVIIFTLLVIAILGGITSVKAVFFPSTATPKPVKMTNIDSNIIYYVGGSFDMDRCYIATNKSGVIVAMSCLGNYRN